eukprot:1317578-Amphidinium_carterae.1
MQLCCDNVNAVGQEYLRSLPSSESSSGQTTAGDPWLSKIQPKMKEIVLRSLESVQECETGFKRPSKWLPKRDPQHCPLNKTKGDVSTLCKRCGHACSTLDLVLPLKCTSGLHAGATLDDLQVQS